MTEQTTPVSNHTPRSSNYDDENARHISSSFFGMINTPKSEQRKHRKRTSSFRHHYNESSSIPPSPPPPGLIEASPTSSIHSLPSTATPGAAAPSPSSSSTSSSQKVHLPPTKEKYNHYPRRRHHRHAHLPHGRSSPSRERGRGESPPSSGDEGNGGGGCWFGWGLGSTLSANHAPAMVSIGSTEDSVLTVSNINVGHDDGNHDDGNHEDGNHGIRTVQEHLQEQKLSDNVNSQLKDAREIGTEAKNKNEPSSLSTDAKTLTVTTQNDSPILKKKEISSPVSPTDVKTLDLKSEKERPYEVHDSEGVALTGVVVSSETKKNSQEQVPLSSSLDGLCPDDLEGVCGMQSMVEGVCGGGAATEALATGIDSGVEMQLRGSNNENGGNLLACPPLDFVSVADLTMGACGHSSKHGEPFFAAKALLKEQQHHKREIVDGGYVMSTPMETANDQPSSGSNNKAGVSVTVSASPQQHKQLQSHLGSALTTSSAFMDEDAVAGAGAGADHPQNHVPETEAQSCMRRAAKHEAEGDYFPALRLYERCLELIASNEANSTALSTEQSGSALDQNQASKDLVVVPRKTATVDVADVLHKIGVIHWKCGSYIESVGVLKEALAIYRRLLVVSRAATIKVPLSNDASADLSKDVSGKVRLFNYEADTLAEILNSIGRVHLSRGEYNTAMRHYHESLDLQTSVYAHTKMHHDETDNESWASSRDMNSEENLKKNRKRKNKKLRQVEAANSHPGVARTMICIGMVHDARGKYNRAMRYFLDGLKSQRSSLGPEHVDVAATLNSVGAVHEKWGQHDRAMECYSEALWIYRTRLGSSHVDVAVTLNNVGQVHHHWAEYDDAMKAYQEALRIMRKILGDDHRNVAATLHNVGLVHSAKGNQERALKIYREVLRIQRAALGDDHIDVAVTLDSIGEAYEGKNRLDRSAKFYGKALRVRRTALGKKHDFVAMTLDRMGRFHMERDGNLQEALRRFEEAKNLYILNNVKQEDIRIMEITQNIEEVVRRIRRDAVVTASQIPLPLSFSGTSH